MAEDPEIDEDPDEGLTIPAREARAVLGMADGLLNVLNADHELANEIALALPPVPLAQRLPEVGPVRGGDDLRLFLLRIAERLSLDYSPV